MGSLRSQQNNATGIHAPEPGPCFALIYRSAWFCCSRVYSTVVSGRHRRKRLLMQCIRCGSTATRRDGRTRLGGQRCRCHRCQRRFTARSTSAFARCCFSDELVALAIRWYLRFRLSYADVVEWLAERGIMVDRSTVYRWVQRFLPLFAKAARFHRQPVGRKWRVDETDCRLNGRWAYCYHA